MKINLLRGYLLSATQHGNKPPSRHEAESLKRRAHHSPYTCTLTTLVNAKIIGRFSPFLMSAIGH
ncbi:TPA: protein sok [Escherichia coli]|nr:protein sok [Escherichia coli]